MSEPRYPFVHVAVAADHAEDLASILWDLGAEGVEERDEGTLVKPLAGGVSLVASFEDEETAEAALAVLREAGLEPSLEVVVGDGWRDEWRKYFKPTRLGPRLVVRPSWEPYEPAAGDVVITLDPGRAFGSGLHETTRLVLGVLDARMPAGIELLDVGCGSGILAIAGLLLGARRAVAVDNDPDAVEVTVENGVGNGVADRLEASVTDVGDLPGTYPFVVANIEARVLIPMASPLAARVGAGGVLVLSGILKGQEDDVAAAYEGLQRVETRHDGEWVALVLERP